MISDEQLMADAKLCDKATPGPWNWYHWNSGCVSEHCIGILASDGTVCHVPTRMEAEGQFIARARTALPAYIEEAKKYREFRTLVQWFVDKANAHDPTDVISKHGKLREWLESNP